MAEPAIAFVLGGVQKAGTTALARYLDRHPQVRLPPGKEAHVFDAPDFSDDWDVTTINARFTALLGDVGSGVLCGDATPISVFHPVLVERIARYNPAMRWIILLRDPVERAISHYHMERARGAEPLGLLPAILAERRRCRGHETDWSEGSPLRTWSYVARGRYASQLQALFARFPRDQVLLLRSQDLSQAPGQVVTQALAFLGLPPLPAETAFPRVFEGRYRAPSRWSPARWALRWMLRGELARLRRQFDIDLQ